MTLITLSFAENETQSPLLRLPAELRWAIYEHMLGDKTICVRFASHKWTKSQRSGTKQWVYETHGGFHCTVFNGREANPFLLGSGKSIGTGGFTLLSGVCRQLYQETATLPFQLNTLAFESPLVMERYLMKERRLSLPLRRAIKTLFVRVDRPPKTIEKYLGSLNTVRVDVGKCIIEYDLRNCKKRKIKIGEEELWFRSMVDAL